MERSLGLFALVRAGACLWTLATGTGCGAAPPPAAQSTAASAAARPEPNAAASGATDSPTQETRSGFHLVEFVGVGRGDRVADLGPGRGYSIAPFVAAVGPFGTVYVRHDPKTLSTLPDEAGSDRTEATAPTNVIRMDTPLEAPFSPEAKNLDCATLLFTYHELVAARNDRHGFNAAVFRALKPGGCYIVAEHAPHSGAEPAGAQDANRVDPRAVRSEIEAAGFRFVEAADFFAPATAGQAGAETSQYVLKFQKPRSK
jgi:predicted methyltransferase